MFPAFRLLFFVAAVFCASCSDHSDTDPESSSDSDSDTDSDSDRDTDTDTDTYMDTDADSGTDTGETTIRMFDRILFYDGYAEVVEEPVPKGVIRHLNSLYAKQLTAGQIQSIRNTLSMEVLIGAACDNYDRIGSVNVALVAKGSETYDHETVDRIEIGRFITPFMDKNRTPDTVPYNFEVNNIVPILKDENLLSKYDIWIELEVFGVPYAANQEIAGCDGRNDVFYGTLTIVSDNTSPAEHFDLLLPLAMKANFNNYQEGASDKIGETIRTINFTLDSSVGNAQFVLIASNHGAGLGGEEYNRRDHFVYFDDDLKLTYKPGRDSCEPFRQYNTQANGIYGLFPKSDAEWQSFSNWCPGDVIDTRIIELGAVSAGAHAFVIEAPDAVFVGEQGNFPLSLYLQAR